MTLNTVRSLRQDLHAKLDVHDKEGLQRVAARLSFTRFSEEGVVPVGAAILMKEYMESSKRPVALPPGTLAKYGMTANCALAGDDTPSEKWA
jgi:hypothetical protein